MVFAMPEPDDPKGRPLNGRDPGPAIESDPDAGRHRGPDLMEVQCGEKTDLSPPSVDLLVDPAKMRTYYVQSGAPSFTFPCPLPIEVSGHA